MNDIDEKTIALINAYRNLLADATDILPLNSEHLNFFIKVEDAILKSKNPDEVKNNFKKVLNTEDKWVKQFLIQVLDLKLRKLNK